MSGDSYVLACRRPPLFIKRGAEKYSYSLLRVGRERTLRDATACARFARSVCFASINVLLSTERKDQESLAAALPTKDALQR